MMQLCFVRLKWTAKTFWETTPRELAQVLNGFFPHISTNTLSRQDLAALMQTFPDKE